MEASHRSTSAPDDFSRNIFDTEHLQMLSETQVHALATVAITMTLLLTAYYIHQDYRAFIALGPGGTPSTPLGYLKIKLLSLIKLRDPRRQIPIPTHFRPQKGYLDRDLLPGRKGGRPVIEGIAPQRQQSEKSSEEVYNHFVHKLHDLMRVPENQLFERRSFFEKHSSALFTSVPITRNSGGEVCHVHPSDGSMHLTLHPADVNTLLETGWGERHPLAQGGWCRRFVPREFCLVYAPRDEAEVEILLRIVAASIWWFSGIDVHEKKVEARRDSANFSDMAEAKIDR